MITDEELKVIFTSAPVGKTMFEVISISASWFSKTYYMQNQINKYVDVEIETGEIVSVEPVPMGLGLSSSNLDLVYERNIVIEMVNDVIGWELSNFKPEENEKPKMTSRQYIYYKDGSVSKLKATPITLEIGSVDLDDTSASFSISTKDTNMSQTGERATNVRFPMQRGF